MEINSRILYEWCTACSINLATKVDSIGMLPKTHED